MRKPAFLYFIIIPPILLLNLAGFFQKQGEQNNENAEPIVDFTQKTDVLLVTESKNLEELKKLVQSMEKEGYFQNIIFNLEVSLPFSYPEAEKDKEMISKEARRLIGPVANTDPIGTHRIRFFNRFFEKDKSIQKGFLLHELAHQINRNSGILDELYQKIRSIKGLDVYSTDIITERTIERIANEEMVKILALPDEILAEKWLYKNWSDLFLFRIAWYFEGDKKNLKELENNVASNKAGKLVLQGIINRILLIRSIYLFYCSNNKLKHLALMRKLEDCIRQISNKCSFDSNFIFEYIDKILLEYTKERISSEEFIKLYLSYRSDFFKNVWNVQIE